MIRTILTEPHYLLREVCPPVTDFAPYLERHANDLIDTMRSHDALGIAAPQIGVLTRLVVVDWGLASGGESLPVVLVNPEVTAQRGADVWEEGCLSIVGRTFEVERPTYIEIRAQRTNGVSFTAVAHGLVARAILHEIDHLDGVTLLRRAA